MSRPVHVAGVGLVSPVALTAAEHAFYLRAGAPMGVLGAFIDATGEPVDVSHCPWLGAEAPIAQRLAWLGQAATSDALGGVAPSERIPTILVTAAAWAGLSTEEGADAQRALAKNLPIEIGATCEGAAGTFQALRIAQTWLDTVSCVLVLAVDSFVSPRALTACATAATPWERNKAPWGEAAAALLIGRGSARPWGTILTSMAATAEANDDNDAAVDGNVMTAMLRAALEAYPKAHPVVQTLGPHNVDELRHVTWNYAACRCFDEGIWPECELVSVEDDIGQVGAASGAVHLAYGFARARHIGDAARDVVPPGRSFAAWSVSRDGTVGLALAEAAP
jgi:hypothetical protein